MDDAKTAATARLPGWVRITMALWAIALMLLALQALELSLFERMGG